MNRPRSKSVANAVRSKILQKGVGSVWTYADFGDLPFANVAATLSRLTKLGVLKRINRGVYYFGTSKPEAQQLADAVMRVANNRPEIPEALDVEGLAEAVAKAVTQFVAKKKIRAA